MPTTWMLVRRRLRAGRVPGKMNTGPRGSQERSSIVGWSFKKRTMQGSMDLIPPDCKNKFSFFRCGNLHSARADNSIGTSIYCTRYCKRPCTNKRVKCYLQANRAAQQALQMERIAGLYPR